MESLVEAQSRVTTADDWRDKAQEVLREAKQGDGKHGQH